MSVQAVKDYLDKYKERIDREIERELDKRLREARAISPILVPVFTAMQELSVGGKRLRGLLTILGYELTGNEVNEEVIKAAVAMEIFHLGLLVHDDLMDRDDMRRGVKTIHVRYIDTHFGTTMAVLAGDYAYSWTAEIINNLRVDDHVGREAMGVWAKYFRRVGLGQTLDVMGEQRGDTSDREVLSVLSLKSGEYTCVLPLLLGATLGGGKTQLIATLEKYGMELGWVFQLRDDYLAEYGNSTITGKPVGNDSREGKRTFATMYGRAKTEEAIKEHWERGQGVIVDLQGRSLKDVMEGLLEWMATREN